MESEASNCEFWSNVVGFVLSTFSSLLVISIVYFVNRFRKRRNIKNTIKIFLGDTIIFHAEKIKNEVPITKKAIREFYTHQTPIIGMYPTFNASILESLPLTEVQNILGENLGLFINVIGRLNNLQQRIPYALMSEFGAKVNEHMLREHESKKDIYDSYEDHYKRCKTMIHMKKEFMGRLDNMEDVVDSLITESNQILKLLK